MLDVTCNVDLNEAWKDSWITRFPSSNSIPFLWALLSIVGCPQSSSLSLDALASLAEVLSLFMVYSVSLHGCGNGAALSAPFPDNDRKPPDPWAGRTFRRLHDPYPWVAFLAVSGSFVRGIVGIRWNSEIRVSSFVEELTEYLSLLEDQSSYIILAAKGSSRIPFFVTYPRVWANDLAIAISTFFTIMIVLSVTASFEGTP